MVLTENAISVLNDRYLLKDENNKVIETPEQLWRRIADTISDNKELSNKIFELMNTQKFLPNSPSFNAGTLIKSYSACYALPLHDSMKSIFQTLKIAALIFQNGGGVGFDFSEIRPIGAPVKSTQGIASGAVSFATVYNAAIETIKQGGKRRGAAIGLLDISHPEIIDWINAKDKGTKLSNFNFSVIITNKFLEALKNNKDWDLKFNNKVYKTLPAKELFDLICQRAHYCADPGIVFIDNINKYNCHKHIGLVHNTNPCGEINIYTGTSPFAYPELDIKIGDELSESCNLGSFDISKYVEDGFFNYDLLARDIQIAIQFLDCIPDKNEYTTPEIEKGTKLLRKIGLGIMGFADTLALLNISYNSTEAITFAECLMGFINYHSTKASVELSKMKGAFPAFKGSSWDTGEVWKFKKIISKEYDWDSIKSDIKTYGIRNCNVNAVAPTGTLAIIAGCSNAIEPIFNVVYKKNIAMGTLYEVNPHFKRLMQARNLWTSELEVKCSTQTSIQHIPEIPDDIKKLFLTAHDIPFEQHIGIQEAFQKYVDINISKTINFPENASIQDIKDAFMLASTSCKGMTVYRNNSKLSQVFTTEVLIGQPPTPRIRYQDHLGVVREIRTACGVFYNVITVDQWGIFEDFQNNSKKGGCDASQKALGRATSMLLRHNVPVTTIIKQFHRVDCNACIIKRTRYSANVNIGIEVTNDDLITILSCADGVSQHLSDYYNDKEILSEMIILQNKIHIKYNLNRLIEDNLSKDSPLLNNLEKCPNCGSINISDDKCRTCFDCHFSKCI